MVLSLVNGSRFQPLHRSRKVMPATRTHGQDCREGASHVSAMQRLAPAHRAELSVPWRKLQPWTWQERRPW
jgi:hypothetical protein